MARMLTARTPTSASQLASPIPADLAPLCLGGAERPETFDPAIDRGGRVVHGTVKGAETRRRIAHAAERATTRRQAACRPNSGPDSDGQRPAREDRQGRLTPVTTSVAREGSAGAAGHNRTEPRGEATDEQGPARQRQCRAPCFLKRRKVKAAPNSGPATGTETESALAARVVAIIGRRAHPSAPDPEQAALHHGEGRHGGHLECDPKAIHDHCGWPIRPRDLVSAVLLPSTSTTNAATVMTETPPRRRCALLRRSVASALRSRSRTPAPPRRRRGRCIRPLGPRFCGPRGRRQLISSHIRLTKPPVREQP